ncbi:MULTISPECIES: ArsR/SmtB family transcription factor [Caloramator]|jgi:DNA-binding transcriptional ArsR family regulator|uniref:Transcriptional regulator, ArsR family n=1 Tax=Caloramator australicus RC3 TaxID=857293 RepID=G0V3W8_9CLOT|nr:MULTISPECIES: metalloregulator ArsR/SmtB family transcription factor [Caloramator]MDO6354747.1 metalloregulator ArsR/SmtB family transcription factor [Caloramator sp. CAR-1]WDU83424.1 metalloregulator ArsR/SmtB family transcription factor [Caloramator sp. Dgby_cultured_2]CCC57808.1 Transcriptional regulator, ArsR family [Caloramator australicus RC3]
MTKDELVVKIFKALGHPIRYKIINYLLDGPKCVCVLNQDIEFSQSNLSQHLRILKDAGIVKSEKVGLNIHYSLADEEIKDLISIARQIIDNKFQKLKD